MTRFLERIPEGSLLFAPMEGITDEPYRLALNEAFPEWDHYYTDFLRIPSVGMYQNSKISDHFGENIFKNNALKKKTSFQILTSHRAQTKEHIEKIKALGFDYLDLNLGCPSKKVNGHKGGAYLLSDLPALKEILMIIRENFKG
ncbi:tRNA-dihydrouridine synthase, partial [Bacteriovoracaceae bacterium]|nr:tRNA-dihydrouridine synthase [Bacteriovoracaceae bacterium]